MNFYRKKIYNLLDKIYIYIGNHENIQICEHSISKAIREGER
jgi:hypothetical protein